MVSLQPEPVATPNPKQKPVHASAPKTARSALQPAKTQAERAQPPSARDTGSAADTGLNSGSPTDFPVGSPSGRGTGAGQGTGTGLGLAQGYVKSNFNYILVSIRRHLQYPDYARRKKLTGTAHFVFVIKRDGTIEHLSLKESSGHDILDEAAEKAIQRAAPFPKPPVPALLVVPINFRLS